MTTQQNRSITASALGLFVVGFVLLCVGGFVQFSDIGSEVWNLPLGYLAAVLAIVSVVIAARQPKARLWLGIVMAVLAAFLVWQAVANSTFRFVWARDEYEYLLFQIGLGVLAFALIATGLQPAREPGKDRPGAGRWLVRAVVYLAVTLLAAWIIGLTATRYYEKTQCAGMDDDCLAGLGGFIWGLGTIAAGLVAVVVIELVLLRRRRQSVR